MESVKSVIENVKSAVVGIPPADQKEQSSEETIASPIQEETPSIKPDESPIDTEATRKRLERSLSLRPEKTELVDKNILKQINVAPAIQAAAEDLKRAKIADAIDASLQNRIQVMKEAAQPAVTATAPDESHIDTQTSAAKLEKAFKDRPAQEDLVDRNILKDSKVAPGLQAAQENLRRSQLEDKLEHMLQQRPKAGELVSEGILEKDETPPAHA